MSYICEYSPSLDVEAREFVERSAPAPDTHYLGAEADIFTHLSRTSTPSDGAEADIFTHLSRTSTPSDVVRGRQSRTAHLPSTLVFLFGVGVGKNDYAGLP